MTTFPTFSILIPTVGNPLLERALGAVAPQLKRGDEVIVMGDTASGRLPQVEAVVAEFGPQFRYIEHDAGHHCWGHCPANAGLQEARGDYIHMSDDDDVHAPNALDVFRLATSEVLEPVPFLFRFKSYFGPIYWHTRGLFARDHIGGHCLLAPNIPEKLGRFTCEYSGDFSYLESTVNFYGGPQNAVWRDEIVAIARPS